MGLIDDVTKIVNELPAQLSEKNGIYSFEIVVAERKTFLSKKKLTYSAKFRVDEAIKTIKFTEMLKESGSGFNSGGMDGEMSMGMGFKAETYNTMSGAREGTIQEQSELFGKKYTYAFDYARIRTDIEKKAQENGYAFAYQITSIGL
jgi:hypothetical protein